MRGFKRSLVSTHDLFYFKKMTKEELYKYVETEISALIYYGYSEGKKNLDLSKSPYDQLVSIGYTKRVIPLDRRCAHSRVTAKERITESTKIEDLEFIREHRNHETNIYTGLEFWLMKYPEDRERILKIIRNE